MMMSSSKRVAMSASSIAGRGNRSWFSSLVVPTQEAIRLVETKTIGKKAVARTALKMGTVINEFTVPVLQRPTMHTVQFDQVTHVAPTEGAEFISHWCSSTNTRIIVAEDCRSAQFVVTADVEEGEDLSFNYNTTEWDMNSPFLCQCPACVSSGIARVVRGHKHLSLEDRSIIAAETSPYIRYKSLRESIEYSKLLNLIESDEKEVYFNPQPKEFESIAAPGK